jgi:uncharacterized RDD family membrane protein YckC
MDESNQPRELIQPEDVTQVAPVAPPPPPPPAAEPLAANAPPPAPAAQAWPPPPAAVPAAPVGPAPGVQFAGHGARLGAYILDAILVGFVVVALVIVLTIVFLGSLDFANVTIDANGGVYFSDSATAAASVGMLVLGSIAIGILGMLYFPFFWARGGATPGMKAAGIRVVNDRDGRPIGWGAALLRLVGFWVSGAVFYLGFVWILIDNRRRGWHDLLAGTCVISTR